MGFGTISQAHQIMVLMSLKGGPEYDAQMKAAAANTNAFGRSLLRSSEAAKVASERTWLHNQALFSLRRYAFYATLAVGALAVSVARLGFSYLSTIQTARVALKNFFDNGKEMDHVIKRLYTIAALSPLLFKDTVNAFRMMYPAFRGVGISAGLTVNTIQALTDALAVAGKTAPGQINRVAVQLQHMAAIGRPTGQVIQALGRDGIFVYEALRKELHLTSDQIRSIGSTSITTKQVLEALYKFYEGPNSPFRGRALALANSTLQGAWQTFVDILSQAAGSSEAGLFGGLTKLLAGVNNQLAPMIMAQKPITLYNVADAMDRTLTPNTHIVINAFELLSATMSGLVMQFTVMFVAISLLLRPLDFLASLFGINHAAAKILGTALSVLIFWWTLAKVRLMYLAITETIATAAGWEYFSMMMAAKWVTEMYTLWQMRLATWTVALMIRTEGLAWAEGQLAFIQAGLVITTTELFAAMDSLSIALFGVSLATLGWIGLAIGVVVLLVVLYYKWTAFHKAVDKTYHFFANHQWAAALLPVVGQLIVMLQTMLAIYRAAVKIANIVHHPGRAAEHAASGFSWHTPFDVLGIPSRVPHIPHFASGGTMGRSGIAMVGERGPEMLALPGGASVHPLTASGGGFMIHIHPQDIYLDGKRFATVMAQTITDKEARL